jgi:diguanylate cyclase (GGDEF)-like protein
VTSSQRAFVIATATAGIALVAWALAREAGTLVESADATLLLLAAAVLAAELFPLDVPSRDEQVTFSTPFAFALLLDRGTATTVIVVPLMLLIADTIRRRRAERTLFNVGQYAICYALAGGVLSLFGAGGGDVRPEDLPALAASGAVFMLVNTVLASAPPAFAHGATLAGEVRSDLGFQAWSTAVLVSLAPIVLIVVQQEPGLFPLIALPLAAIQLGARQAKINQHRARHDGLTGLPNRVLLQERAAAALEQARRRGETVAVLLLGLDGFNEVNQTLGHGYGDALLREVARRLEGAAEGQELLARFGGDEFAVLTRPLSGVDEAGLLAHDLLEALRPQAHLGGIDLDVRATVGIAVHPRDGDDAELLLVRAAMALHTGKHDARPVVLYDRASDDHSPERLALAGELRHGIEAGELVLSYQPKLDLRTGAITGVEALIRWRHPQRGILMPDQFIELAERTGLVRPLTRWTLEEAAEQQVRWSAQGLDLTIAVNISARALTPDLPGAVQALVTSHPGARLEIELTETLMIEGASDAMAVVDALAATGVRLAVDDFGTGYASLAYLKRLPVREVKIDRGFVTAMDTDEGDRAIVRATVDLGRRLGLDVVAEGVESETVLENLRALGCHFAQGFAVGRPMDPDAVVVAARPEGRAATRRSSS